METKGWIHMGVTITTQVYLCLSSSVNGLSGHFVVTVTHFFKGADNALYGNSIILTSLPKD